MRAEPTHGPAAMPGMANDDDKPGNVTHRAVPSGRFARAGAFGRLAGGVAGGMLAEGARRLANGERPKLGDLVMTPGNAARVADRLSHCAARR